MGDKVRQFCIECNQVTTQVRDSSKEAWQCLCCESGKRRSSEELASLKEKAHKQKRLNIAF